MKRQHELQTVGEADIQAVANLLAGIRDPRAMRRLMNEILTPAESRDLALRWRLLQMLHAGAPQRQIALELGISLCKITRGSRILKQPSGVIRTILNHRAPATGARNEHP